LQEATEAVHQLPEKDRNWEGRAHLMAMMFKGQPHRAMSVDSRLTAMSAMIESGKLPGWALPELEDGSYSIAEPVWQVTAIEPLKFIDNQPCFDDESFVHNVLSCAETEGNA
jgi:hypothetical protein